MDQATNNLVIGRRELLIGGTALVAVPGSLRASPDLNTFEGLYDHLTRTATPDFEGLQLELPDVAENGNTVPFSLTADSPMTQFEHIVAMHLLASKNPHPHVATFRLSPLSGLAKVSGRMRLIDSQEVVAIADVSGGGHLVARKFVEVTIGGCGG